MLICYTSGLGSSTVDQVLKYTKYHKHIPSTGQVLIFLKYLSTSSTLTSSTSTHVKIGSKVRINIQSRVNFGWQNKRAFPKSCLGLKVNLDGHILCRVDFGRTK